MLETKKLFRLFVFRLLEIPGVMFAGNALPVARFILHHVGCLLSLEDRVVCVLPSKLLHMCSSIETDVM
jgi:hypothetical protein